MRTTLDIDSDVLEMAKSLALHRQQSLGKVISDLCRGNVCRESGHATVRNGVRVIQRENPRPVTLELVNKLRDELA